MLRLVRLQRWRERECEEDDDGGMWDVRGVITVASFGLEGWRAFGRCRVMAARTQPS